MIEVMLKELMLQKEYLAHKELTTIYFGGGTPSILSASQLDSFFEVIHKHYQVSAEAEVTIEANPDDLTLHKIGELKSLPITRLSLGVQSFHKDDLVFMNRSHSAEQAKNCISAVRSSGFENLTIDLIYGFPGLTIERWKYNLDVAVEMKIPHLSCYSMTVEPKTAMAHFIKTGRIQPIDEEQSIQHFELLMEKMDQAGYEHYEISNFAKPGKYSKHNTNYWLGEPYLGIGPSAHSFNGQSRQWNIANNALYIKSLKRNEIPFQLEELSDTMRYNEYVMTSMRTQWGANLKNINTFGNGLFLSMFKKEIEPYLLSGDVVEEQGVYKLTRKGKIIGDRIVSDLFAV